MYYYVGARQRSVMFVLQVKIHICVGGLICLSDSNVGLA